MNTHHCGRELAREEVITFNIIIEWQTAFASKLAPTWIASGLILVMEEINRIGQGDVFQAEAD